MKFAGKIVAVTGAAGGIGQELCRHFGSAGATIYALDKKDSVIEFASELAKAGIKAHPLVVDIGDSKAVEAGLGKLIKDFGTVDVMINNAGFSDHPTIERTPPDGWAHDINGNLNGAYNCTFAVLPGMKAKSS
ncbi:MAG: SDR family NAD(P)-dependent oxidoreductase, partial [Actinomycetes bacterium]